MEGWRRGRVDNYNPEAARTRSRYKKPPNVGWQQTVPSWEKNFCASVCSIPWCKIMEMKSTIHIYDNILKWDDSAGKKAFNNAKTRFFANMRGFECDVPVPDPDMYIDEINWNSENDPQLELDLENDPLVPDEIPKGESVVIFDNSFVSSQGFSGTGWGDAEQDNVKNVTNSSGGNNDKSWGDYGNYGGEDVIKYDWNNNGWGDGWNHSKSWGWNGNYNESYGQNSQWTGEYTQQYRAPTYRGGQGQKWKNGNGSRRGNYISVKQGRGTQVS